MTLERKWVLLDGDPAPEGRRYQTGPVRYAARFPAHPVNPRIIEEHSNKDWPHGRADEPDVLLAASGCTHNGVLDL